MAHLIWSDVSSSYFWAIEPSSLRPGLFHGDFGPTYGPVEFWGLWAQPFRRGSRRHWRRRHRHRAGASATAAAAAVGGRDGGGCELVRAADRPLGGGRALGRVRATPGVRSARASPPGNQRPCSRGGRIFVLVVVGGWWRKHFEGEDRFGRVAVVVTLGITD